MYAEPVQSSLRRVRYGGLALFAPRGPMRFPDQCFVGV